MKNLLLAVLMLAAGSVIAADTIDPALVRGSEEPLPQGSIAIRDLSADPEFVGSGGRNVDFNEASARHDVGLRVFRANDGGYWLAGLHGAGGASAIQLAIAELTSTGSLDTGCNTTGTNTLTTGLTSLRDVAIGPPIRSTSQERAWPPASVTPIWKYAASLRLSPPARCA